jgi:hypothetical protein
MKKLLTVLLLCLSFLTFTVSPASAAGTTNNSTSGATAEINNKVVPFETNPESKYTDSKLSAEIKNADKMRRLYNEYYLFLLKKNKSKHLVDYCIPLSKSKLYTFIDRGNAVSVLKCAFYKNDNILEKYIINQIKNYIKASKLGNKNEDYNLSNNFKKFDPVSKVQQYMKDNNIIVTNLTLPDTFVKASTTRRSYPFKLISKSLIILTTPEVFVPEP